MSLTAHSASPSLQVVFSPPLHLDFGGIAKGKYQPRQRLPLGSSLRSGPGTKKRGRRPGQPSPDPVGFPAKGDIFSTPDSD